MSEMLSRWLEETTQQQGDGVNSQSVSDNERDDQPAPTDETSRTCDAPATVDTTPHTVKRCGQVNDTSATLEAAALKSQCPKFVAEIFEDGEPSCRTQNNGEDAKTRTSCTGGDSSAQRDATDSCNAVSVDATLNLSQTTSRGSPVNSSSEDIALCPTKVQRQQSQTRG